MKHFKQFNNGLCDKWCVVNVEVLKCCQNHAINDAIHNARHYHGIILQEIKLIYVAVGERRGGEGRLIFLSNWSIILGIVS